MAEEELKAPTIRDDMKAALATIFDRHKEKSLPSIDMADEIIKAMSFCGYEINHADFTREVVFAKEPCRYCIYDSGCADDYPCSECFVFGKFEGIRVFKNSFVRKSTEDIKEMLPEIPSCDKYRYSVKITGKKCKKDCTGGDLMD
ncbi:MAG: hypothetical protein HQK96_06905 [Nitrospirae bacterium]|nr:hypothetical protein [Nitrospirota bacterium]